MDILYQVNDCIRYFISTGGVLTVVHGQILGICETGHKTDAYTVKRDRALQDNVSMYEIDTVSPLNVLGLFPHYDSVTK